MLLTPLQLVQRLEGPILEALKSYESLKDTVLASHRFLDFNKNSVSLEVVLNLKEALPQVFKGFLDVQQISAEAEAQSAFSLRFRAQDRQKERLSLIKNQEELERETKANTLFFKYCFLDYLAHAQLPHFIPLEGSLEFHLEKALNS